MHVGARAPENRFTGRRGTLGPARHRPPSLPRTEAVSPAPTNTAQLCEFCIPADAPGLKIYNSGLWSLLQTGSGHAPDRRALGPRFVRFAALFYGSLVVVAALWCDLRGFDLRPFGHRPALVGLSLGALTAACTVSSGLLAHRVIPSLRKISEELAPRLIDCATRGGLVLVSIFSGVGEEAFFRGALQQEFGSAPASVTPSINARPKASPERRMSLATTTREPERPK